MLQNVEKLFFCHPSSSHFDECADDGTYHVAQKTVGCYPEIPVGGGGLYPPCFRDTAERCLVVSTSLAECRIVVVLEEMECCGIHSLKVEMVMCLQGIGAAERVLGRMNIIMVRARDGRKTRVHLRVYLAHLMYGYVRRQDAVEPVGCLHSVERFAVPVEVGSHASGVDTRVSPACSYRLHVLAQKGGEGTLQLLLDGDGVGLLLPTMIACAVVCEKYEISAHSDCKITKNSVIIR